ncbi:efflux RND transporter periplasmic adaptor subunit [Sphingobacterium paramultivorum]|uniref:Efflux RND transporter periplasmic adaptor subunit n=1 Tax=Sphingobacterium paramultivorum TaxID=2886510 RepID=A0A7G5E1W5_9SPHI|nr:MULTISPECIES: efflux RND transporter periplasmic adaptor subunit [Sphingobacterium]MCS4167926.1 RND family efflux transporter MFP subunit [Sphingobacterium sp. BIGb0116]QMV67990.1 efflux RND transporter periplasmic adaptor subunit [Sphingobacterium paramultivorum]WSO16890.1 efflux RND transporter periplasmic adaptor subunit [Sphingobacterium paramultivorum]
MKKFQFILLISGLFILSCNEEPKRKSSLSEPDIISVKISPISSLNTSGTIQVTGLVSTEDETNYSFKIGGVISSILMNEGQFFRKGQLLATLNTTEIAAGVAQSVLGVEKAQRDYARAASLYKDSVFTLEQLQNTKTALDIAKKSKEAVAFNERYAKIYASSDGFVAKKIASEGEVVGGGMPVLLTNSVKQNTSYILKVGVTDLEWAEVKIGQLAKVKLDGYPDRVFQASVLRKLQSADQQIGSFQVELKLNLKGVIPAVGMFGKAEIATDQQQTSIVIPYSSLVEADGKKAFVFTAISNNKVKKIPVNIEKFDNDKVYLTGQLEGANNIVVSNSAYLNEQSIIKIIK